MQSFEGQGPPLSPEGPPQPREGLPLTQFEPPDVPPVNCCIFYGSNFFKQRKAGEAQKQQQQQQQAGSCGQGLPSHTEKPQGRAPLYDMLLLVPQQQLLKWHTDNVTQHAAHYAPLIRCFSRWGGPPLAAAFALRLTRASGVPVLFNCRVPFEVASSGHRGLCKYGVVPTEAFVEDLRLWRHFYFAGRMQKPVS
ncbi:hypothetical protein Efla_003752 [Eimeria flavescens]